jgi:pimeloyl-ACP methyl ester carboxylesterase
MKKINLLIVLLLLILMPYGINAAEWQWSVPTFGKNARAYLWIPPHCEHVRGIIIGQQVILEHCFMQDPRIREAATKENLALVFLAPMCIGYDDFDPHGKGEAVFNRILSDLAEVSGYNEIANAPFLTVGHSGGGIVAYNAAYWKPERCFGIIGLHCAPMHPPSYIPKANIDGVPVVDVSGQYESWGQPGRSAEHHWRWVRGTLLEFRAINTKPLVSELAEPGIGHFGWTDPLATYLALFIEKAAEARLPREVLADGSAPRLKDIDMEKGWLTDLTLLNEPRYPAAPYKEFTGDPTLAFWQFDEEMAKANETYAARDRGKKLQMVTFLQDGKPLVPAWIQGLKQQPLEDGMSFKVSADFVKETPPEFSFPEKRQIGHATGPIQFRLVGGWHGSGEQTGPDTFRCTRDRFYFNRPWGSLMIMAYHPGDKDYAYTEQPVGIPYPKNEEGSPQTIDFPQISDQHVGAEPFALKATASSGLPVDFCVIDGPVEIRDGKLVQTEIPPRAKFPVTITIAASQWGKGADPKLQAAKSVFRTFMMLPPAGR